MLNDQGTFNDWLNESHDLYYRMRGDDLVELAQVREYAIDNLLLNLVIRQSAAGTGNCSGSAADILPDQRSPLPGNRITWVS